MVDPRSIRDIVRRERWDDSARAQAELLAIWHAINPPPPEGAGWQALMDEWFAEANRHWQMLHERWGDRG